MKKLTHSSKAFLNKNGFNSVAAICIDIVPDYFSIIISDCTRSITLSDNLSTPKQCVNAIYKMETMVKELQKGIDFLKNK